TRESLYADPRSWAEAIHPQDLDYVMRSFAAGRTSGFDYEFRILRPDGALRWIHVRGFPILDQAGNPYRTAGVCADITVRKEAESRLLEQLDELRRFQKVTVERELRMLELKQELQALRQKVPA